MTYAERLIVVVTLKEIQVLQRTPDEDNGDWRVKRMSQDWYLLIAMCPD